MCTELKIQQRHTLPSNAAQNGLAERSNGKLKILLAKTRALNHAKGVPQNKNTWASKPPGRPIRPVLNESYGSLPILFL